MSNEYKCTCCGKFLSYDSKPSVTYTPLNEFGPEEIEIICEKCENNETK